MEVKKVVRAVYVVTSHPVAKLPSGFMVDREGRTVGMDLFVETSPGKWVSASELPPGTLAMLKDRGELELGVTFEGKLYTHLEVQNTRHKLIANRIGLEEAFKAGYIKENPTNFRAEILNPLADLARRLENIEKKFQELKPLEDEARQMRLAALKTRIEAVEKQVAKLDEEQKREDMDEPHLTTPELEDLIRSSLINAFIEETGNALLLNPDKLRGLRALLFSKD